MPEDSTKYDVAISFLVQDVGLAQALYNKLFGGLSVFFFPHNQEELAGTDGLESMREPFRRESRLNVVLYRQRWGNTPWTAVEDAAVKDSCLATGFRSLFFLVVEPSTTFPVWLPDTHVRFNYGEFSLDEAVGAIKLRVQERGGHYTPPTAMSKAKQLKADEEYRWAKAAMKSEQGFVAIHSEVQLLFSEIERQCAAVTASGSLDIRYETKYEPGSQIQNCQLSNDRVGLVVLWHQRYTNSLEDSGLMIVEYNGRMLMHSELGRLQLWNESERLRETKYEPELSRARSQGWKESGSSADFITSSSLAELSVMKFLDLVGRAASGKLKPPSR